MTTIVLLNTSLCIGTYANNDRSENLIEDVEYLSTLYYTV